MSRISSAKTKLHRAEARLAQLHPERRAKLEERAKRWEVELRLAELRHALARTQRDVAGELGVTQPAVSKIERQQDMRIGTMAAYVAALGGRLEVSARFGDEKFTLMSGDAEPSAG